jgi:hypothetical protein
MRRASSWSYTNPATCTNQGKTVTLLVICISTQMCARVHNCALSTPVKADTPPEQWYPLAASLTKHCTTRHPRDVEPQSNKGPCESSNLCSDKGTSSGYWVATIHQSRILSNLIDPGSTKETKYLTKQLLTTFLEAACHPPAPLACANLQG